MSNSCKIYPLQIPMIGIYQNTPLPTHPLYFRATSTYNHCWVTNHTPSSRMNTNWTLNTPTTSRTVPTSPVVICKIEIKYLIWIITNYLSMLTLIMETLIMILSLTMTTQSFLHTWHKIITCLCKLIMKVSRIWKFHRVKLNLRNFLMICKHLSIKINNLIMKVQCSRDI